MGAVLQFKPAVTVDEAWQRYIDLVTERAEQDLWKDAAHNQRLSDAWQRWSDLFQAERESGR